MLKKLMDKQREHNEKVKAKSDEKRFKNDSKRSGSREVTSTGFIYEFKSNGKYYVEVSNNLITISNKGAQNFINKGSIGAKTIKIENITAIQIKEVGNLTGYIQFVIMGSQEVKGGAFAAVQDENTITFSTRIEEEWAKEIKTYVDNYSQVNSSVSTMSSADEILKFKQLLDEGIISEEEFNHKKRELLGL